jgi:hypothetical protein
LGNVFHVSTLHGNGYVLHLDNQTICSKLLHPVAHFCKNVLFIVGIINPAWSSCQNSQSLISYCAYFHQNMPAVSVVLSELRIQITSKNSSIIVSCGQCHSKSNKKFEFDIVFLKFSFKFCVLIRHLDN